MWRFIFIAIVAVGLLADVDTSAHEIKAGDLTIFHPWAMATTARSECVVFVIIENHGTVPDRLIGAASPVAEHVSLHVPGVEDDTAKFSPVWAIDVPPGSVVKLRSEGVHLVLIGLKQPLVEYSSFMMFLKFEQAGTVKIDVTVEEVSATEPEH